MLFVKLISLVTVLRVAISVYLGRKNKGNISPYDHIVYENATPVDIVVPMYNESDVILKTLKSLSVINYSNFRVIVIDDGSTDDSLQLVERNFGQYDNFVILSQTNLGKAEALNNAISASTGEIIICIDADTLVKPNIINSFLPYFDNKDVAAVAGYVKVGNRINLITKIQNIEYVTNQNYVRSIFDSVNGILVVPGAVGAFRTSIIKQVGGYSSGTLTEDSDLTFRIIKRGFVIKNSLDAIGFTEAPATLKMFCRQRVRWIVGNLQVLTKYRNSFFSHENKFLRYLVIPYTWIFDLILPAIVPFLDYKYLYLLLTGKLSSSFVYFYISFIVLDSLTGIITLVKCKEKCLTVILVFLQRLILRHLMLLVYINILIKAINGSIFEWGKIKRYGSALID